MMKIVLQTVCACLVMQVALAVKGNEPEPVCDAVCPIDNPITDNVLLKYDPDCGYYCHCANNGNWKQPCPPGLEFNEKLEACDWPSSANCTPNTGSVSSTTSEPDSTTSEPASSTSGPSSSTSGPISSTTGSSGPTDGCDTPCGPNDCSSSSNSLDCQKYCVCSHGTTTVKECSPGLWYNPVTNTCDYEANVNCPLTTTAAPNTDTTPEATSNSTPESSTETSSEPNTDTTPEATSNSTPESSSETSSEPNTDTTPEPTSNSTPESSTETSSEPNTDTTPEATSNSTPESSSETSSEPNTDTTPEATSNSTPETSSETTTEEASTESTSAASTNLCDAVCPDVFPVVDNNHRQYPGDCTKFCHCANDGNHVKDCPSGLEFNQRLEVCDHAWAAGCTE
ncbi:uncharacterized protein [Atheta coriaria]|uniref:uncharacterized protein n=1 Tax=Dalotia coriaria TaxID=877792 RepID=UPI0031F37523